MFLQEPTGPSVDIGHVTELDDAFFSSDPFAYFLSRIASIANSPHSGGQPGDVLIGVCEKLRRPLAEMPKPSSDAVLLQQAVDAVALRHHIAETLVRLWLVSLVARDAEPGSICVWEESATGSNNTMQVIDQIIRHPLHGDRQRTIDMLMPVELQPEVRAGSDLAQGLDVLIEWWAYSARLLQRSDIHLSAAYNKVKHGLAVRPRDDMRMDAILATRLDGDPLELPLSALQGSVPIIDKTSVLYLARPPKGRASPQECLEMTCLQVDTVTVLAECFMMATVHAAVFHSLARRYESWRGQPIGIPPYPRLATGPTPDSLLGAQVVGLRAPVTLRPDGTRSDRGPGIAFSDFTFQPFHIDGPGRTARIVDG